MSIAAHGEQQAKHLETTKKDCMARRTFVKRKMLGGSIATALKLPAH